MSLMCTIKDAEILTFAKHQVTNAEGMNTVFTQSKTSAGIQPCQIFLTNNANTHCW